MREKTPLLPIVLAVLAVIAAACANDEPVALPSPTPTTQAPAPTTQAPAPTTQAPAPTTQAPAPTTQAPAPTSAPTPPPAADGPTVRVAASGHGDILTDGDGNTLYLFMPDDQGPSVCNDACAATWPPLEGEAVAGAGADPGLLGTAVRDDGTAQATYNGWPLYRFAGDAAPGDTNGQSINDIWWVISPTGDAIM